MALNDLSAIKSVLEYACPVHSCLSAAAKSQKIESIQRWELRIITGAKSSKNIDIISELELSSLCEG